MPQTLFYDTTTWLAGLLRVQACLLFFIATGFSSKSVLWNVLPDVRDAPLLLCQDPGWAGGLWRPSSSLCASAVLSPTMSSQDRP